MQIHHQIAIVTDVLTDFIHAEQKAEVSFLAVHILLDLGDELLDAHIGVFFAVKPVAGGCLAHAENGLQDLNYIVLEEGSGIAGVDPLIPVDFLEGSAEGIRLALLVNEAFQLRHLEVFAIEAAVVIEYLRKNAQHGSLVLVDRSFDVNVEQDGLRGDSDAFLHRRIHHRIVKLVRKVIKGVFTVHLFVGEKVGEHFQEVRFTTSKEAGNPDADLVGRIVDGFDIVIKERGEMTPQLFRDYVLAEFLLQTLLVILRHLDNAVDVTVDVLLEHTLYFHSAFLQLQKVECPVVVSVQKLSKQSEVLSVERSRIEHDDGDVLKEMLHTVQHFMRAHKREDFSHAGQEENITVFVRLVLHVFQKCLRRCDLLKLLEKVFLPALFFQSVHGFQDALVLQELEENLIEVAFFDVVWHPIFRFQPGNEVSDDQFIRRIIAEHMNADFVA